MKRRIWLSLLLCLLLIPGATIFTACGDGEGYQLSELRTDFNEIVTKYDNVNLTSDNRIEFDYSIYTYQNEQYFTDLVNSSRPYSHLNNFYNRLLDNSLQFVYNYIDRCSTNELDVEREKRNKMQFYLQSFDSALNDVSLNTSLVAEILRFNINGNMFNSVCMNRLKNLFDSYDNLYLAVYNITDCLSDIYFNYALSDYNFDFSSIKIDQFDANRVTNILDSKIQYNIVYLTRNYTERNVKGGSLSTTLTTDTNGFPEVGYNLQEYQQKVSQADRSFSDTIGDEINASALKQDFFEASIKLYNLQTILNNNYDIYIQTCEDVVYLRVAEDINASDYETLCLEVIDNYSYVVDEYNACLVDLLAIMENL